MKTADFLDTTAAGYAVIGILGIAVLYYFGKKITAGVAATYNDAKDYIQTEVPAQAQAGVEAGKNDAIARAIPGGELVGWLWDKLGPVTTADPTIGPPEPPNLNHGGGGSW